MNGYATSLNAQVLVLNKLWMAVRVTDARRAFSMLFCNLAEVIHVDDGAYTGHDFEAWSELSLFRDRFDSDHYEWVRTVRSHIVVPQVIRLLGCRITSKEGGGSQGTDPLEVSFDLDIIQVEEDGLVMVANALL